MQNNVTIWNAIKLALFIRHNERGARMMEILHEGKNHRSALEDNIFVERVGKILEV